MHVFCVTSARAPEWTGRSSSRIAVMRDRTGDLRIFSTAPSKLSYRCMGRRCREGRLAQASMRPPQRPLHSCKLAFGPVPNPRSMTTHGIHHGLWLPQRTSKPLDDVVIYGPLHGGGALTVPERCRNRHSSTTWSGESVAHSRASHTTSPLSRSPSLFLRSFLC